MMHSSSKPSNNSKASNFKPGWYRTVEGSDWLLYSLNNNQWYAHTRAGDVVKCEFSYIAQAGLIERLEFEHG